MAFLCDVPVSIRRFLEAHRIGYEIIPHSRDFTAQRTAEDTFTPGRCFAKTVLLAVDDDYRMAVVAANRMIDLEALAHQTGAREVRLATESEIGRLFPDCEIGSEPPFGSIYGMQVFISEELTLQEWITFNGGTHEDCIRMPYSDFERAIHPVLLSFGRKG